MKLYVSLSLYNGTGSCASIEDTKEDHLMRIREGYSLPPKTACKKAAQDLREAAARFDLLAEEKFPYNITTHDRINKTKVTI